MSILIKGMEMPTSCEDCPMCHSNAEYDYAYCCVSSAETSGNKIPSDCPLVPIPPHGRLGDLDALHKLFLEKGKEYKGVGGAMVAAAAWCIANAPTIIPAEEGE